jgi:pimeloyl-ACP methyl ester carboxylesterase
VANAIFAATSKRLCNMLVDTTALKQLASSEHRRDLERIRAPELSADPKSIDEARCEHYARLYARPGAMHAAFNQFAAFQRDAVDNKAFAAKGKLTMPVLAIGAEKSFGSAMADDLRFVATDVTSIVIANSGHWLMEEQPAATIAAIRAFLDKKQDGLVGDIPSPALARAEASNLQNGFAPDAELSD